MIRGKNGLNLSLLVAALVFTIAGAVVYLLVSLPWQNLRKLLFIKAEPRPIAASNFCPIDDENSYHQEAVNKRPELFVTCGGFLE